MSFKSLVKCSDCQLQNVCKLKDAKESYEQEAHKVDFSFLTIELGCDEYVERLRDNYIDFKVEASAQCFVNFINSHLDFDLVEIDANKIRNYIKARTFPYNIDLSNISDNVAICEKIKYKTLPITGLGRTVLVYRVEIPNPRKKHML